MMMKKVVGAFASLLVLLFSISVSAKSTIDDVLSPSLSFTRKLLLSDECLNDELLMTEDEELDKVTSAYRATCPAIPEAIQDENGTVLSYKLVLNNTGCDSSSVREYCDANYKTAEFPNVSCPDISEWTMEDIVQNAEKQGGVNSTQGIRDWYPTQG